MAIRNVSAKVRWAVFERDGFRCVYCGRSVKDGIELHADHVLAVSRGGRDDIDNLVTSCSDCNLGKNISAPPRIPLVASVVGAFCRTPLFIIAIGSQMGYASYGYSYKRAMALTPAGIELPPRRRSDAGLWDRVHADPEWRLEICRIVIAALAASVTPSK